MSSSVPKVLIVGAGPSGLVAALTLLQNGVPVRIIEKEPVYHVGQRGTGISPRSLELYHFLGVSEILENATFRSTVRKYVGGSEPAQTFQMMPWIDPTPSCPWLTARMMGQDRIESILRSHLETFKCRVELGTKLRSFEQHSNHVDVDLVITQNGQDLTEEITETACFDWVVGADGAHGVVRKALGLTFLGETREERMTTGDIHVNNLATDSWHRWGNVESKMMVLKPTENKESDVFQFFAAGQEVDHIKLNSSHTELVKYFESVSGMPAGAFGEVVWVSEYRPNIRMVNKFGEGRVFVVGDAAHVHSPTGGQGLNSGIQDSFNLAWKLTLVCKSLSPSTLLSSYGHERLPVIAEMLNITTKILKKSVQSEDGAWQRGGKLLQLGVNYRGSDIVVDETDGDVGEIKVDSYSVDGSVRGGDRAPDGPALGNLKSADETPTRLFDIFKPQYHTAVVFVDRDAIEQSRPILQALRIYPTGMIRSIIIHPQGTERSNISASDDLTDFILEDCEGHAYKGYDVSRHAKAVVTYIVRPDGVIGGIVHSVEGLKRYFGGIFLSLA